MSSLPGHTPSSQGSSSSESLISSEPSDSGFHSVSTGEHRRLHKIHGSHAHRQMHFRSGHSPREQRGRWDLESIPESASVTHSGVPASSHCTVGNSTTTTVHFHRAERSPTLSRHCSPPSPSAGTALSFRSPINLLHASNKCNVPKLFFPFICRLSYRALPEEGAVVGAAAAGGGQDVRGSRQEPNHNRSE